MTSTPACPPARPVRRAEAGGARGSQVTTTPARPPARPLAAAGRRARLPGPRTPPRGGRGIPGLAPGASRRSGPGTAAQRGGRGTGGPGRGGGLAGGTAPRPQRRPGPRAGSALTFVLGHQPLERRPRHRPGNSCAVGPRLQSARILPPEAGAASGSPRGPRSPSGARGALAQCGAASERAGVVRVFVFVCFFAGLGGVLVAPRSGVGGGGAPVPSAGVWGERRSRQPSFLWGAGPPGDPGQHVGAPVPSHCPMEDGAGGRAMGCGLGRRHSDGVFLKPPGGGVEAEEAAVSEAAPARGRDGRARSPSPLPLGAGKGGAPTTFQQVSGLEREGW